MARAVKGTETSTAGKIQSQPGILAAHLAMVLFALLVSTSFIVGAKITHTLDPVILTLTRMVLASAILLTGLKIKTGKLSPPAAKIFLGYFWLALLLCIFFVTMFEALRLTSSLATGAVFTLVPPMTALISWVMLRQSLSPYQGAALLIAALAALWVVFGGDVEQVLSFNIGRGEAIYFIGCAAYAGYSPSVRWLHGGRSLLEMTAWVMVCSVILLGLYGWRELLATGWLELPATTYLGIAYLAVFTTSISFYLMQFASLRLPSAKVMAYTYLVPILVLVQSVLLGGSLPSGSVVAGVMVITSAVFLLQRSARWT